MISIVIPGQPIAQPRHKIAVRGGFAKAYIDGKHPIHGYKQAIALIASAAMNGNQPLDCPLSVRIAFVFQRPASHSKKRRAIIDEPHSQKPDIDNLCKAVFDGLNKVVWSDDSQVVSLVAVKRWANEGEGPFCRVEIF